MLLSYSANYNMKYKQEYNTAIHRYVCIHIMILIGTCVEFASSDYLALESANVILVLSGQVISESFNVTVIATACASSSAPATG